MSPSDPHKLYMVALPSRLSTYVTLRTLEELVELRLKPRGLVVNTAISAEECLNRTPWVKVYHEQEALRDLRGVAIKHDLKLRLMPLLEQGVSKRKDLLIFYKMLRGRCGIPSGVKRGQTPSA